MQLALEHGLGLEIMAFAYPDVLDGNWKHTVATYKTLLRSVVGPLTLHGPFFDMAPGSPDPQINELTARRYQQALHIAAELEVEIVNLHANFIGSLHNPSYRTGWHQRNVPFWGSMAELAQTYGVTVTIENMWEFQPGILAEVLREVDHPYLKACLDVGHATVFGEKSHTLDDWIDALRPYIAHTHMNNNNGVLDEHYGLNWSQGVLNYHDILPKLRALKPAPNFVLEMWQVDDMRDSLGYFDLPELLAQPRAAGE